jgi:hypothetical protein
MPKSKVFIINLILLLLFHTIYSLQSLICGHAGFMCIEVRQEAGHGAHCAGWGWGGSFV